MNPARATLTRDLSEGLGKRATAHEFSAATPAGCFSTFGLGSRFSFNEEPAISAAQELIEIPQVCVEPIGQVFTPYYLPVAPSILTEAAEVSRPLRDLLNSMSAGFKSPQGIDRSRKHASLSDDFGALLLTLSGKISPQLRMPVRELLNLEQGWDGEHAKPIRVEALGRTLLLLRRFKQSRAGFVLPFIAPTFDGSVLLDWTRPRRSLELEPQSKGWSVVGTLTDANGRKDYFHASFDQNGSGILKYYDWFQDDLLLWPTE